MPKDSDDGESVISMSGFMNAMRFSAVNEVEAYWEAIRGGRLVPRRSDIDPRGIERALEYAFILERIAPGIARLRIAGSHLSELMGMEVRGMPLSAFVSASSRSDMGEILEQVFDSPAKAIIHLHSERGIGKPALDAKLLVLPMKSDLGDISRALGCIATSGDIGRSPRRFEITSHTVTPLLGDFVQKKAEEELADPRPEPGTTAHVTSRDTPPLQDPGADFIGAAVSSRQTRLKPGPRPYLKVVDTTGN